MLRPLLLLIFVAVLFSASTCERPADVEIDGPDPMLVVVSNFSDQQALQVQVSKSIDALAGGGIEYVEDANVELFEEENFIERLQLAESQSYPFYTTIELQPKAGIKYTIHVDVPGFKRVSAQSTIPPQIKITKLEVTDLRSQHGKFNEILYDYNIALAFIDPGRSKNFYHLKFFQQILEYEVIQNDTVIIDRHFKEIAFSPVNDNNNQLSYFNGGVLFEDGPFDGQLISYSFPFKTSVHPDRQKLGKVFAELRAVSEEYYLYHNSLSRQKENPGIPPFTEPVTIFDNIENGQGIFAGYSTSMDSLSILP